MYTNLINCQLNQTDFSVYIVSAALYLRYLCIVLDLLSNKTCLKFILALESKLGHQIGTSGSVIHDLVPFVPNHSRQDLAV